MTPQYGDLRQANWACENEPMMVFTRLGADRQSGLLELTGADAALGGESKPCTNSYLEAEGC